MITSLTFEFVTVFTQKWKNITCTRAYHFSWALVGIRRIVNGGEVVFEVLVQVERA